MAGTTPGQHQPPTLARLAELAGARIVGESPSALAAPVTAVDLDSTKLEPGALFAAVPGTRVHGASYAFDSPAGAILTDEDGLALLGQTDERRPILVVEDVRRVLGAVAAEVYGHPTRRMTVIGVTGTSGKTTTTYLLERGLMAAGHKVGLIGTTGTRIDGREVPTTLTTPEATTLQRLFKDMADDGITHVVMEVSSHALELGRVGAVEFDAAGFTNLSQDHLDFHPTMGDYFEAKALFFDPASAIRARRAVVCVDDEWGQTMARRAGDAMKVATRGQAGLGPEDVTARQLSQDATGAQRIALTRGERTLEVDLPLPGDFNIANAAVAVGLAAAVDVDLAAFTRGLEQVAVPGRMEAIAEGQDFTAVVDYAHKPAAVAAVLDTLRAQSGGGRVGIALGAGGDRDASKRAVMGAEAARRADLVIVTDDNPRTEEPAPIRAAVVAGAREVGSGAEIREIADRAEAIDALVAWARPGDTVVVTGKGHEIGQIVGSETRHFDDREEVRRALTERATQEKGQ